MQNHVSELSAEDAEMLELGAIVGQNQAFGLVAGRCSAAQAETLRRLRDEKKYKRCTEDWRQFCSHYLNMSGAQADRIIALLEKFGPGYFELAQLTRISPETYQIVEPAVQNGALHCHGEAIHLDPENARKVAAAVARLRREAVEKKPAPNPSASRLADIERRFSELIRDMQEVLQQGDANWAKFSSILDRMTSSLRRLKSNNGIDR